MGCLHDVSPCIYFILKSQREAYWKIKDNLHIALIGFLYSQFVSSAPPLCKLVVPSHTPGSPESTVLNEKQLNGNSFRVIPHCWLENDFKTSIGIMGHIYLLHLTTAGWWNYPLFGKIRTNSYFQFGRNPCHEEWSDPRFLSFKRHGHTFEWASPFQFQKAPSNEVVYFL